MPDRFKVPTDRKTFDADDLAILLAASADLADSIRTFSREAGNAIIQAGEKIASAYEHRVQAVLDAQDQEPRP